MITKINLHLFAILLILFTVMKKSTSCCPGEIVVLTVTGASSGTTVWGSNPYSFDSDMAVASVHAGLITVGQTAQITKTFHGVLNSFTGTTSNGITTDSYGSYCGFMISLGASTPTNPCNPPINCGSIPNCNPGACTSNSFCTACATGYGKNPVSIGVQNCQQCSSYIPQCSQCTTLTSCDLCNVGYYVVTTSGSADLGKCDQCSSKMTKCLQCTVNNTCTKCDTDHIWNTTTRTCWCNPSSFGLSNCQTCSSSTVCTSCVSNLYFIKPSDNFCHSCSQFDTLCQQCSAENVCSLCQTNYIVQLNADGLTTSCGLCSSFMPQCVTCSSQTVCTSCQNQFGLNNINTCTRCDLLISPPCLTCFDYTACQSCKITHFVQAGSCVLCSDHLYKCQHCLLIPPNPLQCTLCQSGYYVHGISCKNCLTKFDQCSSCSFNQCFTCLYPYLIGSDKKCSKCYQGYQYHKGFCMNIPGCISSLILKNGTQVCLACAEILNFYYDSSTKRCLCNEGFIGMYHQQKIMTCQPVCGDGIVSLKYEQCDDKNSASNDGCDSNCKIEQDFKCSIDQPSKCVLYVNFSSITYNYVKRLLGENTGVLSFTIRPKHKSLGKFDWSKIIKFNFSQSAVDPAGLKYSYSYLNGRLQVTVPYMQELQNQLLSTDVTFDTDIVVSVPKRFLLFNKLNGINAPLIFQDDLSLSTHKNITIITMVLAILLLLQFYLSSYFHKMIGLETIQVIQCFYFVRMVSKSTKTSVLSSMNLIQYSATGYENAEMIFGPLEDVVSDSYLSIDSNFIAIDMKSFFLMNINFMLIPIVIATVAYAVSLIRKYRTRNEYAETRSQQVKDNYTNMRRSAQWVYDHFFFPYVIMFFTIIFFFSIQQLTSQKTNEIEGYDQFMASSFPAHLLTCFIIFAIYCHELFYSLEEFRKYRMTEEERQKAPTSLVQKLEHDENNSDRANYHPAYVLVYLLYYLILNLAMVLSVLVEGFTYSLELALGLAAGYFVLLLFWKPYHQSINVHNLLLKVYYGTFVAFLVICYMISKVDGLPSTLYVVLIYCIMGLIFLIFLIGFVRISVEKYFRKKLLIDNTILQWSSQSDSQIKKLLGKLNEENANEIFQKSKAQKNPLLINNPFNFQQQVFEVAQNITVCQEDGIYLKMNKKQGQKLSKYEEELIINKIRQEINEKNKMNIIDQMVESFIQYNKKLNKKRLGAQNQYYQFEQPCPSQKSEEGEFSKKNGNDKKQLKQIRKKLLGQFLYLHQQI